jgi:predicted nucleotidyltransferase
MIYVCIVYDTSLTKIFGLDLDILYFLVDRENEWISLSQISRDLGLNKMTVRRSLEKILTSNLVREKNDGYRRYFKLKRSYLITVLRSLKNVDSKLIGRIVKELKNEIEVLLLYGSRADGTNSPDSDWDLLVVSQDINPITLNKLSNDLKNRFGQEVNFHLYTKEEMISMRNEKTPFWLEIRKKMVPLVGDIDDL